MLKCDVKYLREMARKAEHPLPAHLLPGKTRGAFVFVDEFREWVEEEERRKEWSTEAKGAN